MDDKKIAMERYELQQLETTKKATIHFYALIILNILLAVPTLFEPGELTRGICTLAISTVLSVLVFCGIKYASFVWVFLGAVQLGFYFLKLGVYLGTDYPMTWFLLMCARCAFCLYSGWAFVLSYDVQDIVRERGKKLFKKSEK